MNKNSKLSGKFTITLAIFAILSCSSVKAQTTAYSAIAVNYESFNATSNSNAVKLNWSIGATSTNDYFEIERSFDNSDFSTAALILGAESENAGMQFYSFQDKDKRILNHEIVYYRLKKIDANGNYTYSTVKTVRLNNRNSEKISVKVISNHYNNRVVEVDTNSSEMM
jgi:hypothetical protein